MPRVGTDVIEMVIQSLAGKGGKEAKSIMEDLHHTTGLSIGYLYKVSDPVRLNGRAARHDAGARRVEISEDALEFMHGLTAKFDLDAAAVIELAVLNEKIGKNSMSAATYRAWLREEGISRARLNQDVRPYTPWEAAAPNIVHHFDTTKLEELHIEGGRLTWDPRANRKNARGVKPDPIWLYSMVDDHSRCKFAYLYRSENQFNHLDFLFRAWSEKANPSEFPFYGIPGHIYMDKGGINYSLKVINALSKLGIHVIPTTPSTSETYGSRKHGKVENPFKTYNAWMKGLRPRLDPSTNSLRPEAQDSKAEQAPGLRWEEAQESLYCFLLKRNRRVHSTTGVAPFERWLTIGKPQHPPSEELWMMLRYENDRRRVNGDLTFTINNHLYRLPEKKPFVDWVKEWVEVYWLKDRYEKVTAVRGAKEIEVAELRRADIVRPAFSYDREEKPAPATDQARARANGQDYGGIKLWDGDGSAGSPQARQAYLPRRGEKFDDTRIAEKTVETDAGKRRPSFAAERYLSYFEALSELQDKDFLSRPLKPGGAEQAWLKSVFAGLEKIAETALAAAVKQAQDANDEAADG